MRLNRIVGAARVSGGEWAGMGRAGRRRCQDRAVRSAFDVGEEGRAVWDLMVSD